MTAILRACATGVSFAGWVPVYPGGPGGCNSWPTPLTGSPAMSNCAAVLAQPVAASWRTSSRICASGSRSSRSIGACCRRVRAPASYCSHRDLPDKQGPNQRRKPSVAHARTIAVIGLGYVGLPVAVGFARTGASVIGFDIDAGRIADIAAGHDRTREVATEELRAAQARWTADPNDLRAADFFIVTVPTPIDEHFHPDLSMLLKASELVGRALKRGDLVVS